MSKHAKEPEIGSPTVAPAEGCELIRTLKQDGEGLSGKGSVTHEEEQAWITDATQRLSEALGRNHPMIREVIYAQASRPHNVGMSPDQHQRLRADEMAAKVRQLAVVLTTLERQASRPASAAAPASGTKPTVVNNTFHGPVGSVQSGGHNVAYSVQSVGPDMQEILKLIADLRALAEHLDATSRGEAVEHLNDLTIELQGEKKPSRVKAALRSLGDFASKSVEFGAKVGALAEIAQKLGWLPK
jgi:hypothetical protein